MKGLVKFILAIVVFLLIALLGGTIFAFVWIDRHFYVAQPIPIEPPQLDLPHQAKLLKLLPLANFFQENRSGTSLKLSLTEKEANWLLNHYLSKKQPQSKAELKLEENRMTGKYCRQLNPQKYQNLIFDAEIEYQNCIIQIDLERVQIGDFLLPTTLLGQVSSLIEYYLENKYCSANKQDFMIQDLKLKPNAMELLLVKP